MSLLGRLYKLFASVKDTVLRTDRLEPDLYNCRFMREERQTACLSTKSLVSFNPLHAMLLIGISHFSLVYVFTIGFASSNSTSIFLQSISCYVPIHPKILNHAKYHPKLNPLP